MRFQVRVMPFMMLLLLLTFDEVEPFESKEASACCSCKSPFGSATTATTCCRSTWEENDDDDDELVVSEKESNSVGAPPESFLTCSEWRRGIFECERPQIAFVKSLSLSLSLSLSVCVCVCVSSVCVCVCVGSV